MPPETAKLLHDMSQAAERIGRFIAGKSFDDYVSDELLRSGVERQFAIIGEAMSRLLRLAPSVADRITDHRKIAGFRNVLVHAYDAIDHETTWGVVAQKLPTLVAELRKLLAE